MNALTLRLPDEIRSELEHLSERQHKPISEVVRDALRRYIAVQEIHELRKKALPYAEKAGIFSDEDVFKVVS